MAVTAAREAVLRRGKAGLAHGRSGRIVRRGACVPCRSSGPNRIKGGPVQLT